MRSYGLAQASPVSLPSPLVQFSRTALAIGAQSIIPKKSSADGFAYEKVDWGQKQGINGSAAVNYGCGHCDSLSMALHIGWWPNQCKLKTG